MTCVANIYMTLVRFNTVKVGRRYRLTATLLGIFGDKKYSTVIGIRPNKVRYRLKKNKRTDNDNRRAFQNRSTSSVNVRQYSCNSNAIMHN